MGVEWSGVGSAWCVCEGVGCTCRWGQYYYSLTSLYECNDCTCTSGQTSASSSNI